MAVFTAIATAIATSIGMTLAATSTALFITATAFVLQGVTMMALSFGGMALSKALSKSDFTANSPTYSAIKQTQTNPDLPVPLLYGTVKLAGNRIWQDDEIKDGIKRIVAFSDGVIEDFTDIRLNDIPIKDIAGIKIEKFYGTSEQGLPTGLKVDTVGSLKHLAYLYIKVPKSEKIDINYNLTTIVKGRKVRVYSTPTSYEVKYSENPAWILLDFLTAYNGRGLCLKKDGTIDDKLLAETFDLNTFIESAAFCDEEVTTNGVKSPRFTFNMIFDSQTSHKTLLDEIFRNCRGGLFTKNGKFQFKIDKAEPVSKVFTEADILDGSETFQTLPNEENYEVLKLDYISPEHEWNKVQAYAEMETTKTGVPIEHSVNAYSITNFQQASRLAWYYLNSKRICPYFGSFKTGFKAYDLEVGQVIQIPVILMGLNNYLVKVTSVINNGTGTYTVNYRTYDESLYSDELGCKEPTIIVSNLSDIYGYPADVQNFNVVQDQNLYRFIWDYNASTTDTYQIRLGESWETGTVIGSEISTNNFVYQIQSKGLKKFWIKAFNGYNFSENATLDVLQVNDIPNMNDLVVIDVLDEMNGSFENTKPYHDVIKLNVTNVLWQNTNDKWNEGENQYYQNLGIWGADVVNGGSYTSQVFDIKENLDCYIFSDMEYSTQDFANYCSLQFRISEDNKNWSEWKTFATSNYQFRYIQFKVIFNVFNNNPLVLTKLIVTIDVPDKVENMEAEVTEATEGVIIEYKYNVLPSIVATVNDSITAYAVVENKTTTNAKILIYDNDGNLTTGKLSLVLKGY